MKSAEMNSKAPVIVWLILVAASLSTTWIGDHNLSFAQWGTVIVMLVAAIKTRLILTYYMEINTTPLALRLVYDAWIVLTTAAILYFWFAASN